MNKTTKRGLEELLYTSGSLFYQPHRFSDDNSKSKRLWDRITLLAFLSAVPISLAGASGALAAPPSYFNDRNFLIVVIAVIWLVSPCMIRALAMTLGSRNSQNRNSQNQEWMWRLVAIKDSLVAVGIVVALSAITCGAGGNCKMWSGYYRYGPDAAQIPLITAPIFHWNGYVLYPALVSVCIGWNIATYFGVRYFTYCGRFLGGEYSGAATDAFRVLVWRYHEIQGSLEDEEGNENAR